MTCECYLRLAEMPCGPGERVEVVRALEAAVWDTCVGEQYTVPYGWSS